VVPLWLVRGPWEAEGVVVSAWSVLALPRRRLARGGRDALWVIAVVLSLTLPRPCPLATSADGEALVSATYDMPYKSMRKQALSRRCAGDCRFRQGARTYIRRKIFLDFTIQSSQGKEIDAG